MNSPLELPPSPADAILGVLARFPNGATSEEIHQALAGTLTERTLVRWLGELRATNRIVAGRDGRTIRYLLPGTREVLPVVQPQSGSGNQDVAPKKSGGNPSASTAPAPGSDESIEKLIAKQLPMIVAASMPPPSVAMYLESAATRLGWDEESTARLITLAQARAATLTLAEAQSYGITPAAYAHWREWFYPVAAVP